MFASMRDRLSLIAREDSDRSEELGNNCPSELRIILNCGFEISGRLADGENSLDDQTIDVVEAAHDCGGGGQIWMVAIASIAAVHQTYPTEARIASTKARATA